MQKPTVSIITICYNAEAVIEATLQSVAAQTYPNIEYIVVDGASKDNTMAIVQRYASKVTRWVSEKDKNHFDAMNKGMHLATGDLIWYVHAGDRIYAPNTLELAMQNYQGQDFVYGDAIILNLNGEERPWHKPKPSEKEIGYKSFIQGMVICHQAMLVRKSVIVEYDLQWKFSSDIDWSIRVLKNAKTFLDAQIPLCTYLDGGISGKHRRESLWERWKIQQKHFNLLEIFAAYLTILYQFIVRGRVF